MALMWEKSSHKAEIVRFGIEQSMPWVRQRHSRTAARKRPNMGSGLEAVLLWIVFANGVYTPETG